MNEELQKALAELFNSALSVKDFVVGELPEYIEQLLLWHAIHSAFLFFCGLLFCFAWGYANYRQIKWLKNGGMERLQQSYDTMALVFNIFQVFLFFIPAILMDLDWLQIMIAPKVWLIEYAAQFVK